MRTNSRLVSATKAHSPSTMKTGRIFIVGSTGFIGRFITDASLNSGHRTYLLVRSSLTSPSRASTLKAFKDKGATIIHGSINDQSFVEGVLKEEKIDVVISAVGGDCIEDQIKLIQAIKNVGTVKRFLPSEFGHDIDRADPVEPGLTLYNEKRKIRRFIEENRVPYTYVCCNSIAAWPYHNNTHPSDVIPPMDSFHIYGDGSVKAYFVAGTDIGKFTVKLMDDPRALNKTVHFQPQANLFNVNELAAIWEEKIGYKLPRVTITEDDLLAAAKEMIIPESIVAALTHDIFIKGCQITYSLDRETDVEVCALYPDAAFRTVENCFNDYIPKIPRVFKELEKSNGILVSSPKDGLLFKELENNNGILVPSPKDGVIVNTA